MGDYQQRQRQAGQQLAQGSGEPLVQSQRGFIENGQFRHVGQRHPQHQALLLAARQLLPIAVAQLVEPQRARDGGVGAAIHGLVQRHHFADAGQARHIVALQQAADALARGGRARIAQVQRDAAPVRLAQAQQRFHQYRLAAAVTADEGHALAAPHRKRSGTQRESGRHAQLDVPNFQQDGRFRQPAVHGDITVCRRVAMLRLVARLRRAGARRCPRRAGGRLWQRRLLRRRVNAVLQQHLARVFAVDGVLHCLAQLADAQVAVAAVCGGRVQQQRGMLHQ